jgi:head-tail adaptor
MASAGAKTELIVVERYVDSPDGAGGAVRTWNQVGLIWADPRWIGGSESDRQGALRAAAKYRFTVLSAAAEALALGTEDRLVWNGERFNIRERPRRLPRAVDTEIIAETGVADTFELAPMTSVGQPLGLLLALTRAL